MYWYTIAENGSYPVDPQKMMYAQSFCIFAFAEYGLVFNKSEAIGLALNLFHAVDAKWHDNIYGGYNNTNDYWGLPPNATKSTNVLLHLLESFTTLYEASSDATVLKRLEEMVNITINRILQPPFMDSGSWWCAEYFQENWAPVLPLGFAEISYGHDLEIAMLLTEAARVLERPNDTQIMEAVLNMGIPAAVHGYDNVYGGYFSKGVPTNNTILDSVKYWWVQTECISGLWKMFELTGNEDYLSLMEGTMQFVQNYMLDYEFGELFAEAFANGTLKSSTYKGDIWKASYHTGRTPPFVLQWITQYLIGLKPTKIKK